MIVKTNVTTRSRITSVEDAPAGSITWTPPGPLSRDVWVRVYVYPAGTPVGDITTWPALGLNLVTGTEPTVLGAYEPAYYNGDGDGSTSDAETTPPWPVSWPEGATIIVIVNDYGPCTDGSCPDNGTVYDLPSGFGGLPAWVTDGTAPTTPPPTTPLMSGMALVWDRASDRHYEAGLDKGVLYLPDGSAVPWNGLTSVIEHFDKQSSPVYFDGMKTQDLLVLGDFSASMKAVTYPEEFDELEGQASNKTGLFYGDQPPKTFGLCYRTLIGDGSEGDVGYKIHIIYNLTAIPNDKTYVTLSDQPSLLEFEWNITAVPEEVPGFRPTAQVTIDSRKFDPWLLEELEAMLYGSSKANAALIPMADLAAYINTWYRIKITDNGDGTWTATTKRDGFIHAGIGGWFEIVGANAVYLNDFTFELSDTIDRSDVPQIEIFNNGDGTWTAQTDKDVLFEMTGPYEFAIKNANVIWIDDHTYQVSNTTD